MCIFCTYQIPTRYPEEKGALIAESELVSEQLEVNNPAIEHEIERIIKEADEIGITLAVDL